MNINIRMIQRNIQSLIQKKKRKTVQLKRLATWITEKRKELQLNVTFIFNQINVITMAINANNSLQMQLINYINKRKKLLTYSSSNF